MQGASNNEVEGGTYSKWVQTMRVFGHNVDVNIELATVTSPPPALKIKVDNMSVELEKDDLIVAQSLTKHKRKISLSSSGKVALNGGSTTGGMSTELIGTPSAHAHTISSLEKTGADMTVTEADIEYLDELKNGERIIVASVNEGQLYIVLDRAVIY